MNASKRDETSTEGRHSIAVVSRRTGITQLVLRAWERRYGAVVPSRTATGRRLYSDQDLKKLSLLQMLTNNGHRIGDIANLSGEELRQLAAESGVMTMVAASGSLDGSVVEAQELLGEALMAVQNFDDRGLETILERALLRLSKPLLRKGLLAPLLEEIGVRWGDGRLRIAHEHIATAIVSAFLTSMNSRYQVLPGAPLVAVATPSGHWHELGALLAASQAYESGWDVLYLGSNMPAEEIATAANSRGVRAIMLSLVFPTADPGVMNQLRELRKLVGPDLPVLVGGHAAPSYLPTLTEIRARIVGDTEELGWVLTSL
jgi:DNA-binding transcriptional MerR regulator/methylmalonyl-CoA mutase cobalamin-binding subunit